MASGFPEQMRGSALPPLAVVIPMFNEEQGAQTCVEAVTEVLESGPGDARLIAVDDGSSDATPGLLDELAAAHPLLSVVHHETNKGYGAALRTGAETARSQGRPWVLFMDSDLTNPAADVLRFWPLMTDDVDLIKGSRYVAGGSQEAVPLRRRAVSVAGNTFARLASGLPVRDLTNGFRAIRAEAFLRMPLEERGFALILEEVYWASRMSLRCAELPTTLGTRAGDLRPSSFAYTPATLWAYGRYPLRLLGHRATRRLTRRAPSAPPRPPQDDKTGAIR
jgi:glycosyltransferase involved in cell wall biosynthesis